MTRDELRGALLVALEPATPPNVGDLRRVMMVDAVVEVVADLIWSKSGTFTPAPDGEEGGEFVPSTWRKRADDLQQERDRLARMAAILTDLNRCEHGRHEGDNCYSCQGTSPGNPVVRLADTYLRNPGFPDPPLRTIGFDLSGNPIVVPDISNLNDPDAWRTR
jgi:hypothetical protein